MSEDVIVSVVTICPGLRCVEVTVTMVVTAGAVEVEVEVDD